LVKSRRDLETLVDDLLLTLKLDIVRPLDEARDITLGLNILTYDTVRSTVNFNTIAFNIPTPKFLGVFSIKGLTGALEACFPLTG
jgi:hypothetical protein